MFSVQHVLRNLSIRTKITAMTMLSSLVLLFIATGVFVTCEILHSRHSLVEELTTLAEVVGTNSTGAVSSGDAQFAEQTLGALRAVSHLRAATIYTINEKLFAQYRANTEAQPTALTARVPVQFTTRPDLEPGARFVADSLELVHPITVDGNTIGTLVLQADLRARDTRLRGYILMSGTVLVGGAVFSFLLAGIPQRVIAQPIIQLVEATSMVSHDKNYTIQVERHSEDELGQLAQGFNDMLGQIQARDAELQHHRQQLEAHLIALQEGTQTLSTSIGQLSTFLGQLNASSSETATSVNETATIVEEVKQTAHVAYKNVQKISETGQKTAQVSIAGESSVVQAIQGMNHVREKLEAIAESVLKLGEQHEAIGEIITAVNDLAEQSNVLAINAAIEAAKAGEAGKGFSVVAQEVKNLANQSKQATTQVHKILNDVQQAVNVAVFVTEQGTKAAATGVQQSLQAGESIRALSRSITDMANSMTQIAASSQQQQVGMDQVASAMESIRKATSHNVDGIRQLESTARKLQQLGENLTGVIVKYNTSKAEASDKSTSPC